MTIPISSIVNVGISIGASFPARKGFGILNCVTAETGVIGFAERIRSYGSAEAVAADWAGSSEVVKLANAYFGQQPKPTDFRVSVRAANAVAAELRGGSVADDAANLALFTAITDGSFTISIDGNSEDVTAIDFTGDTNLSDVAATIETELQAIVTAPFPTSTVTYEDGRFFIRSGTTGAAATISFLTAVDPTTGTDISSLLQMQQGEATKTDGIDPETITEALNAIEAKSSDWYGLIFTKEVRDAAIINTENAVQAAATWIQARVKVFFNTSNDLDVLDSVTTSDIASVLNDANYTRTITTFSSLVNEYPSASVAGRAFTVDFSQPNSTITLKFKQLPGVTAEDLNETEKSALDGKRANAFFNVGADTVIYGESYMAGDFFFDEIHGTDWLTDAIQKEVYGYLISRTTKVPYTDSGVAALEQQTIKILDEGVRNGLLAPGETIDGEFLPNGYKTITVPVADVSQTEKDARQYNGLSFVALGAGAIHGVQIQGTFER
jgi:hypothetical protein